MRQKAPIKAVGCIIDAGQDGKTEILAEKEEIEIDTPVVQRKVRAVS